MKILAFTVTRAATPERITLLQSTISSARRTAGHEFDWIICASGCSMDAEEAIRLAFNTNQLQHIAFHKDNIGQHIAWNWAFEYAVMNGYTHFLRLDDDVEFLTKRWLKKLATASQAFDDKFCISPRIRGLKNPPLTSQPCEAHGHPVVFLFDAIGGICRWHPIELFKDFIADVRKPLGSGDATGVARYCVEKQIPMVYLHSVRVKHARTTRGQEASDPTHFSIHGIFQNIPYIPTKKHASESTSNVIR